MRKYYPYLEADEKQQVANCFNEKYGRCLAKARHVIKKAEQRGLALDGTLLWTNISLRVSKKLAYLIPYEDYLRIYKRVQSHNNALDYSIRSNQEFRNWVVSQALNSETGYVTIKCKDDNKVLAHKVEIIFNLAKAATCQGR